MSKIEWTEISWNPTVGCSEKSAGCVNCYAAKMAWRLMHNPKMKKDYNGVAKKLPNGKVVWTGKINLLDDVLLKPAKIKKPTVIFPGSMSDLFHEDIPFSFIDKVFAVMMLCPQHTFQVLTKRTQRMLEYCLSRHDFEGIDDAAAKIVMETPGLFHVVEKLSSKQSRITNELLPHLKDVSWVWDKAHCEFGKEAKLIYEGQWPAKHIWLGTSIEDQKVADERGKPLYELHRMGWVTWVSNEPMIGPVNWETPNYYGFLNWMVTGGESGSTARPMNPDWARTSRDFCEKNKIPFFFKQHGQYIEHSQMVQSCIVFLNKNGHVSMPGPAHPSCIQLGDEYFYKRNKHDNGRLLDGKLHHAYPIIIRDSQTSKQ